MTASHPLQTASRLPPPLISHTSRRDPSTTAYSASFLAFAAARFLEFFAAFLLADEDESTKAAPGGPEVAPDPRGAAAPGARYLPGPVSSGAALAALDRV